ncbi:universal stress protein in QAH/OAS sulfhydrylase 3'region-like [Physella acuta]|uniref:universal stress protein in QAH/OAS sulfhydrylase 3'region-like n=1 Tax=Physella acuta TaxID=109671 RepID=UPI0027DDD6B3|nr:universal stress protein in QAH/OAS sulfhydrylase 3'region-like [Physella acuta]
MAKETGFFPLKATRKMSDLTVEEATSKATRKMSDLTVEDATSKDEVDKKTVLIAMDGSDHSFYAFDWFMTNVYKHGLKILVAHCPDYKNVLHAPVLSMDTNLVSRMIQQGEEEINKLMARIQERLASVKPVEVKLVRLTGGDAGSAIVRAADEHKVDFIVTGSRGLGSVRRTIIGSVSTYVLHHAHCPVLICPKKT